MGDEVVRDDAAHGRDDKRNQQPTTLVVKAILVIDRVSDRIDCLLQDFGWRALPHL